MLPIHPKGGRQPRWNSLYYYALRDGYIPNIAGGGGGLFFSTSIQKKKKSNNSGFGVRVSHK